MDRGIQACTFMRSTRSYGIINLSVPICFELIVFIVHQRRFSAAARSIQCRVVKFSIIGYDIMSMTRRVCYSRVFVQRCFSHVNIRNNEAQGKSPSANVDARVFNFLN